MLNTSEIAYIGGYDDTGNVPMEQILLYNTKSSLWYTKTSKAIDSTIPSKRRSHSASIDGRIFVYGGYDGAKTASTPTFLVLEYINNEFVWSSPQLFNQSYVMRILHTSHVFENYLIIAFGRNLTENRLNTIDLIDISDRDNYHVVTDFVPTITTTTTPANPVTTTATTTATTTTKPISTTDIIVASVSGIVGLLMIIGGIYFLTIRYRKRPVPTPGNDERKINYLPSTSNAIYERNNNLPYTTPYNTPYNTLYYNS